MIELRDLALDTTRAEVREQLEGLPVFSGTAIVFDTRTAIGNPLTWGFFEEIAPGAATKTLSEGDQRFLVDHDPSKIVARRSNGLTLTPGSRGLDVEAELNTRKTYVADLVENLRDGSITGMSFGFRSVKEDWFEEPVEVDGHAASVDVRRILELQLVEVSAVTFPAYESTSAGLRSGEIAAVGAALARRGDQEAFERRAALCPDLLSFRHLLPGGEPRESTHRSEEPDEGDPVDLSKLAILRLRADLAHAAVV